MSACMASKYGYHGVVKRGRSGWRELSLFFLCLGYCQGYCEYGQCKIELTNQEQCYLEGDDLIVQCKLNDRSYDIQNVTIIYEDLKAYARRQESRVLNNNTVQMTVHNITNQNSGTYICYYDDPTKDYMDNYYDDTMICVQGNYKVPDEIACTLHNAKVLECSWMGQTNVCWSLSYKIANGQYRLCNASAMCNLSTDSFNSNCCFGKPNTVMSSIPCENVPFTEQEVKDGFTLNVMLTGSYVRWTKSREYRIQIDKTKVILGPMRNLSVINTTPSGASISWEMLHDTCSYDTICRLAIHSYHTYQVTVGKRNCENRHGMFNFSNLRPYQNYTVNVSCKIQGALKWSDIRTTYFTTKSARALRGPRIQFGSYVLQREKDSNTTMLVLYWKPPEPKDALGIITGYKVKLQQGAVTFNSSEASYFPGNVETAVLQGIDLSLEMYTVTVWSINNNTESIEPSRILISTRDRNPSVRHVYVKTEPISDGYTGYTITWSTDSKIENVNITFYWCAGRYLDGKNVVYCESHFDWQTRAQTTQRKMSLTLASLRVTGNTTWYFGVALTMNNISSGIKWHDCLYTDTIKDCYATSDIDDPNSPTEVAITATLPTVLVLVILVSSLCCCYHKKLCSSCRYKPNIEMPAFKWKEETIKDSQKLYNWPSGYLKLDLVGGQRLASPDSRDSAMNQSSEDKYFERVLQSEEDEVVKMTRTEDKYIQTSKPTGYCENMSELPSYILGTADTSSKSQQETNSEDKRQMQMENDVNIHIDDMTSYVLSMDCLALSNDINGGSSKEEREVIETGVPEQEATREESNIFAPEVLHTNIDDREIIETGGPELEEIHKESDISAHEVSPYVISTEETLHTDIDETEFIDTSPISESYETPEVLNTYVFSTEYPELRNKTGPEIIIENEKLVTRNESSIEVSDYVFSTEILGLNDRTTEV